MKLILTYSLMLIFVLTSCNKNFYKENELLEEKPFVGNLKNKLDKEIIFVGLQHIGKSKFYYNINNILSLYQDQGYIFLVEGVNRIRVNGNISNLLYNNDTFFLKKIRKIFNFQLDNKTYYNFISSDTLNPYNLIVQPTYPKLGLREYSYIDSDYKEMIEKYEARFGEIVLDSCDLISNLDAEYNCVNNNQKLSMDNFVEFIAKDFRNTKIIEELKKNSNKKIVILYGKDHFKGLRKLLNAKD